MKGQFELQDGLITVPIDSRPRESELRPYMRNLQSHILFLASKAIDECDQNPNLLAPVKNDLLRLMTALSTETKYIRIPVVWAIWNNLCNRKFAAENNSIESNSAIDTVEDVNNAVGVFLSHFDLAGHLSDAYLRQSNGDDQIDTAFFHDLDERVAEFDSSRQDVFSDDIERAKRISSVLRLPSGAVPRITYFSITAYEFLARRLSSLASIFGVFAVLFVLIDTSGLFDVGRLLRNMILQISGGE